MGINVKKFLKKAVKYTPVGMAMGVQAKVAREAGKVAKKVTGIDIDVEKGLKKVAKHVPIGLAAKAQLGLAAEAGKGKMFTKPKKKPTTWTSPPGRPEEEEEEAGTKKDILARPGGKRYLNR